MNSTRRSFSSRPLALGIWVATILLMGAFLPTWLQDCHWREGEYWLRLGVWLACLVLSWFVQLRRVRHVQFDDENLYVSQPWSYRPVSVPISEVYTVDLEPFTSLIAINFKPGTPVGPKVRIYSRLNRQLHPEGNAEYGELDQLVHQARMSEPPR